MLWNIWKLLRLSPVRPAVFSVASHGWDYLIVYMAGKAVSWVSTLRPAAGCLGGLGSPVPVLLWLPGLVCWLPKLSVPDYHGKAALTWGGFHLLEIFCLLSGVLLICKDVWDNELFLFDR